jgi:glycosyltransferase involved in cell wall biosynthesis
MSRKKYRISIFSLFRDSEDYIDKTLSSLGLMEDITDAEFEYFFYENDSKDNTARILSEWIENKNGKLKSDTLNEKSYGSTMESARVVKMAKIRNSMAALGKPVDSDFTIVLDSDVEFSPNIINDYFNFLDLNFSMLTPNIRQNVPCKMGSKDSTSYYDSWSLVDHDLNQCMTWSSNPFYRKLDRDLFNQNKPIDVYRSFGGFVFIKSEYFNQTEWFSEGQLEHWHFCDKLRGLAPIYFIPSIRPSVTVNQAKWENEDQVVKHQEHMLKNKWNRFLLKTQGHKIQ